VSASTRGRVTILHTIFIEDVFDDGIRRAIVPSRVMIQIESDSGNRALPDIGATPAARRSHEFATDFEF
jgi:hypothetical protein